MVICKEDLTLWGLNDNANLDMLNEDIISILKKKNIVIDDCINELDIIAQRLNKTNNNNDEFILTIIPSLACNFSCWYCYEDHSVKDVITESGIKNILTLLNKTIIEQPSINNIKLDFFGGEPMLHYNDVIQPLLVAIKSNDLLSDISINIGMTTNGYLFTNDNIPWLKRFGLRTTQITLDGNRSQHNKIRFSNKNEDTYSTILTNVRTLLSHKINVMLRLNISETTHLQVNELLHDFQDMTLYKNYLHFSVFKVWQAHERTITEVDRIVKEIRTNGFECTNYYSHPSSISATCYADKTNQIVICPKDKVFKCTARDFRDDRLEGILLDNGNIEWTALNSTRKELSPLDNKECRHCKILPICCGGCSQHLLENSKMQTCPLHMNKKQKLQYAEKVLFEKITNLTH